MPTAFQRPTRDEQKIVRLIAAQPWVPVADAAAASVETERCNGLVGVRGLTHQLCEAYHEIKQTSQEEAERILKEKLPHCAAEAALGGHDLGEWQERTGPGLVGYQARCKRCKKTPCASRLVAHRMPADVCQQMGIVQSIVVASLSCAPLRKGQSCARSGFTELRPVRPPPLQSDPPAAAGPLRWRARPPRPAR